jgi:hypothetical protein
MKVPRALLGFIPGGLAVCLLALCAMELRYLEDVDTDRRELTLPGGVVVRQSAVMLAAGWREGDALFCAEEVIVACRAAAKATPGDWDPVAVQRYHRAKPYT